MKTIFKQLKQDKNVAACADLFHKPGIHTVYGVAGSQKSALVGLALEEAAVPLLIITNNGEHLQQWQTDLQFFAPQLALYHFPIVDRVLFSTTAKSMERRAQQIEILGKLSENGPCVVLATAEEAAQYIEPPSVLERGALNFAVAAEWKRDELLQRLGDTGYERTDLVEGRGYFAVRGDIIDIFSVNHENPLRIEFFGDEIDSIRFFDVMTQRSLKAVESARVLPLRAGELGHADTTILQYINHGIVVWDDPVRVRESLNAYLKESEDHKGTTANWRYLVESSAAQCQVILSLMVPQIPYLIGQYEESVTTKSMTSFRRQFHLLAEEIVHWRKNKMAIIFVLANRDKIETLLQWLQQEGIPYSIASDSLLQGGVTLLEGTIQDGFEFPYANIVVLSEQNIYGTRKQRLRKKTEKGQKIDYFTDLKSGEYVVHEVHGIGRYMGIKTIESADIHKAYLEIHYAGKDTLYVPTDQLNVLQKYIGKEGEVPKLHKMGGIEWRRVRDKAQKSIDNLANELVEIYAKREIATGFAFLPDTPWQKEFEDQFPFEETPDQITTIMEIKANMEKPYPMDRLVCGDVGFGKTEVALRAVFKAVMSGKQVAVLVPTTVLAQQHFKTFTERFRSFGISCEVLNRFRSLKEKKDILNKLVFGNLDVLIGTHSLLNKKVVFKDLGLLVVDEEQRFGVTQKEKWKSWSEHIDVLTLSATPIPRTLHMSLVGVREMSVIDTPPEDRFPVQTYVAEYDTGLVSDAIRRETRRGGQVYFVYNRVATIARMGEQLQAMLPDLRIGIAHGQMTGSMLERVMMDFYEGRYDVLLCSSLIENGLDVSNANTMIVYDADRLGLSQLYQMRGRVGRSRRLAYAYFLYRRDKSLSEVAEKRLQAIKEFTELGAGFKVAMRDLEIRGAGNLLGREQHGNIASVGFAMYCRMLEEAVERVQKGNSYTAPVPDPVLEIRVDAFIDDAYIGDSRQKIEIYQRLGMLHSLSAWSDLTDELVDRFGTPSLVVENLLAVAKLKLKAKALGISSIVERQDLLEIKWRKSERMGDWDLSAVEQKYWKRMKFLPAKPVTLRVNIKNIDSGRLAFLDSLLGEFLKKVEKGGCL